MNVKLNYWKSDRVSPETLDDIIGDAMRRRMHRVSDMVQEATYDEETESLKLPIPKRWLLSHQKNLSDYDIDYELRIKGFGGVLNDILSAETHSHAQQLSRDIVWKFIEFLDVKQDSYIDEFVWERVFNEHE